MVSSDYDGNDSGGLWIQRPLSRIVEPLSGGSTTEGIGGSMRRRLIIAAVAVGAVVYRFRPMTESAYAVCAVPDICSGSSVVTATLTGTLGTRSVGLVNPITINSVANATTLGSTWGVAVAEVGRSGTDPWSIGATLSGGQVTS